MHNLVSQMRFTRNELLRSLEGVTLQEATVRFQPMNSLSWIVGHLADQEHLNWVVIAQGRIIAPHLRALVGYGQPASTPPLDEMLETWHMVTHAADDFLNQLDEARMEDRLEYHDNLLPENIGTRLNRIIYHYWYHIGEGQAIRQMLGHTNLPEFVGDMSLVQYHYEA